LKALQYGDNSVLYTLAVLHLNEPDYAIRYMEKYMEAFPNDKKAARVSISNLFSLSIRY